MKGILRTTSWDDLDDGGGGEGFNDCALYDFRNASVLLGVFGLYVCVYVRCVSIRMYSHVRGFLHMMYADASSRSACVCVCVLVCGVPLSDRLLSS